MSLPSYLIVVMTRLACIKLAVSQYGLVTVDQAEAAGWSPAGLWRAASRGEWEKLLPRVYRFRGTTPSWEQSVMAACLCGGCEPSGNSPGGTSKNSQPRSLLRTLQADLPVFVDFR